MIVTTNSREFVLKVNYFGTKTVPDATKLLRKKLMLQLLTGVVKKTPVRTGRAKGSWGVTLGAEPSIVDRISLDPSGAGTMAEGEAIINGIAEPFGRSWIQSNLIYILALEHGHSKRAPNGMVLLTVKEVLAQFKIPGRKR